MEAAIEAAEAVVPARHAEVEGAANSGRTALADACRQLEQAEARVRTLYARWEELEAKRK